MKYKKNPFIWKFYRSFYGISFYIRCVDRTFLGKFYTTKKFYSSNLYVKILCKFLWPPVLYFLRV